MWSKSPHQQRVRPSLINKNFPTQFLATFSNETWLERRQESVYYFSTVGRQDYFCATIRILREESSKIHTVLTRADYCLWRRLLPAWKLVPVSKPENSCTANHPYPTHCSPKQPGCLVSSTCCFLSALESRKLILAFLCSQLNIGRRSARARHVGHRGIGQVLSHSGGHQSYGDGGLLPRHLARIQLLHQ